MKKAGVLGFPVSHSLSPRLHGYWMQEYKIRGMYTALEVQRKDLSRILTALESDNFAGVNLTLPLKEAALDIVEADETARAIGAVNTVWVEPGKIYGTNTDAYGFIANLESAIDLNSYKKKAVVLGAGGASRAICYALHKAGFEHITLTNRTQERAEDLARHFKFSMEIAPWDKRTDALTGASLLVNTTKLGMKGQEALELSLAKLPVEALVTDIVYAPLETKLLRQAKAHGNKTVDGLGMLLYQGQPGFEKWFGVKPEVTEGLRKHMLAGIA